MRCCDVDVILCLRGRIDAEVGAGSVDSASLVRVVRVLARARVPDPPLLVMIGHRLRMSMLNIEYISIDIDRYNIYRIYIEYM